ncbi:MAG: hypothetical protein QOD39_2930, partial [Mycobacterium sp.]|nr:hypothetical protein [Mycobacterium sp.]
TGTSTSALARQLRPVALALAAQLVVSGGVAATLNAFEVPAAVLWSAAAAAGLVVCVPLLYWFGVRKSS